MHSDSKLDVRPSDLDQSLVRVVLVSAVVIWSYANAPASTPIEALGYKYFTLALIYWTYSLFACGWTYFFVRRAPEKSGMLYASRVVSIFADIGAISGYTAISGSFGVILFPVYLNSIIGYGYRFGVRYLYFTLVVAAIFFSIALVQNSYIRESRELTLAYYLGIILVPLYSASLLKRHREVLERVRDLSDARSRFIANVSHELRTPLHAIISVSDVLRETLDDVRSDKDQRYQEMQMISDSAQHLLGLVNKILDVAAADAGRFSSRQRERTDVFAVAQTALRICQPKAQQQKIDFYWYFDADIPAGIMSLGEYLQEILINTVGNAVKYTASGHVQVRLRIKRVNLKDSLVISIVDTGIGIAAKFLPNIFEPFTLGDDSAARRYSGTGLGLTLTKQYVEMLDGYIEVQTTENCGTHFMIYLPIDECPNDDSAFVAQPSRPCLYLSTGHLSVLDIEAFGAAGWECRTITTQHLHELEITDGRVVFVDSGLLDQQESIFGRVGKRFSSHVFVCYGIEEVPQLLHPRFNSAVCRGSIKQLRRIQKLESASLPYLYEEPSIASPVDAPVRVLVVDDNLTNLTTARMALEGVGHSVVCVSNGEDALLALDGECFGIAFIDMHMPGMSGIEVAQVYQFISNGSPVPIVILTADATQEARTAAEACGAVAFLTKPLRANEFRDAVNCFAKGNMPAALRTVANSVGNIENLPILDVSEINELIALNVGISELSDMVSEFEIDCLGLIECAVRLRNQTDPAGYNEVMHSIKGSAATLGAVRLSAFAGWLEHRGIKERLDDDGEAVRRLTDLLTDSLYLLRRQLSDGPDLFRVHDRGSVNPSPLGDGQVG